MPVLDVYYAVLLENVPTAQNGSDATIAVQCEKCALSLVLRVSRLVRCVARDTVLLRAC
jgi:hypothetical protein